MAKTSSKTAFVLSMPSTMSASAIVDKGKAQGISLSTTYVHTIRSKARATAPKGALATSATRPAPAASRPAALGSLEERYVDLVLELGLVRAEAMLSELRKTVAAAIG